MPEPKHTPEPWLDGGPGVGYTHDLEERGNSEVALVPLPDYDRAIVCVNACRGLNAADLEAGLLDDLVEVAVVAKAIIDENDGLLLRPRYWQVIESVYERLQGRVKKGDDCG